MIYVENKKKKLESLLKEYPGALILDVTSSSNQDYARMLSPFYPHGNIPVPFTDNLKATCVESVWQGLKVFKYQDVDLEMFRNDTMKNLKRTVRRFGPPLGHRKGAFGKELLNYFDARVQIYLPTFKWVLDNVPRVHELVEKISAEAKSHDIVLLDYNTNCDFRDVSKPLSHAGLIKLYIEGKYPTAAPECKPLTQEEINERRAQEKAEKAKRKKEAKKKLAALQKEGELAPSVSNCQLTLDL